MKDYKRLLEINLTTQDFHELKVSEDELRKYLGGSGLATKYLHQYLDPSTPPCIPIIPSCFSLVYLPAFLYLLPAKLLFVAVPP